MGMGNPFAVRIILSSFVFTFIDAGTVMFQILILIFFTWLVQISKSKWQLYYITNVYIHSVNSVV